MTTTGVDRRRIAWAGHATAGSSVVRALDAAPLVVLVAIAWWTLLFHLAVPLRWSRDVVGAMWFFGVVAGIGVWVWWRATERPTGEAVMRFDRVAPPLLWVGASVAAAVPAAVWAAAGRARLGRGWWLFWLAAVVACVAALIGAARSRSADSPKDASGSAPSGGAVLLVVGVAILAALGSAVVQRPDADDVFLVNRTTYVSEYAGPLPERDTIFSNEYFAASRPDTAPTSIEALLGVIAARLPMSGPTLVYLVFGPLVAGLAVLALWRMLRTLGAVAPALATAAASAFLLLDGSEHASFGNLGFARSWQGKVMFLAVVVPVLWHLALRWGRDGHRVSLALLGVVHVAAVGLTNSASFIAPAITAAVVVAGAVATRRPGRIPAGLAMTAPALAFGLAFAVLPRQPLRPVVEEAAGTAMAFAPGVDVPGLWYKVFGAGPAHIIPVACVLLAWLFVRDRAARFALVAAPIVVLLGFLAPGVPDLLERLTGARNILWRVMWVLPVPAAVGLALTAPLLLRPSTWRTLATVMVPVALLGSMVLREQWVPAAGNQFARVDGFEWDVDPTDRAVAERLMVIARPGGVVLAPVGPSSVVAISTSFVHTVNPRPAYMLGRHAIPEFRARERVLATDAVTTGLAPGAVQPFTDALEHLEVTTVCVAVGASDARMEEALGELGFQREEEDPHCTYWDRDEVVGR